MKVVYRPWKDNWRELYRTGEEDIIYLYSILENRAGTDKTRVEDLWDWPFMWSKTKVERLSWMHKLFYLIKFDHNDIHRNGFNCHVICTNSVIVYFNDLVIYKILLYFAIGC